MSGHAALEDALLVKAAAVGVATGLFVLAVVYSGASYAIHRLTRR